MRGYRTNNRKWTENKFKVTTIIMILVSCKSITVMCQVGEEKPEVLDDWDQRLVVTLLEVNDQGNRLSIQQVAEKEQVIISMQIFINNLFV